MGGVVSTVAKEVSKLSPEQIAAIGAVTAAALSGVAAIIEQIRTDQNRPVAPLQLNREYRPIRNSFASELTIDCRPSLPLGVEVERDLDDKFDTLMQTAQRELKLDTQRHINIVVCGISGSGKSSLVNALRGLRNIDPDAAPTNVTESTRTRMSYVKGNCRIDDIPGYGTVNVDLNTYVKKYCLYAYDMVLCVSHSRFLESDMRLAQKINSYGTKFILIRNKTDHDIESLYNDQGLEVSAAKSHLRSQVMKEVQIILRDSGITVKPEVLFVSARLAQSCVVDLNGLIQSGKVAQIMDEVKLLEAYSQVIKKRVNKLKETVQDLEATTGTSEQLSRQA
ncbi:hypothetical protein HDU93_007755 [Gonapodya sp. JEL0774]|nr:hypothetical protein HDU93_007755 [Gonapodya sp. JEL0774]